jgi:hypothetical protein
VPVISDVPFAEAAYSEKEPVFWPVEMANQLPLCADAPRVLSETDLVWVRDHLAGGAALMDDPSFNRAIQTLDGVAWAHSLGAGIVMTWAAIETLIQPGRQNVAKKLAMAIAAYLEPPSPERDRLFQRVRSLYEARGGTAHAAHQPEPDAFFASLVVARAVFCRTIERRELPDAAALVRAWTERMRT